MHWGWSKVQGTHDAHDACVYIGMVVEVVGVAACNPVRVVHDVCLFCDCLLFFNGIDAAAICCS